MWRRGEKGKLSHRCFWSGRWESNPRPKLGKLLYCHCTTPARCSELYSRFGLPYRGWNVPAMRSHLIAAILPAVTEAWGSRLRCIGFLTKLPPLSPWKVENSDEIGSNPSKHQVEFRPCTSICNRTPQLSRLALTSSLAFSASS